MIKLTNSVVFWTFYKKPLTYISQVSNNMELVGKPRQWWDLDKKDCWNGVRNPFIFSEIELGGLKEATSTHKHTVWGRIQSHNSESVGQQDFPWRSPFATMPRKVVIALTETPIKIWHFIVTFYLFFYVNSFSLTHQHSLSSAAYSFIYHIWGPYNQEVLITYYISVCYQLRRYHRFSITVRAPSRGSLL